MIGPQALALATTAARAVPAKAPSPRALANPMATPAVLRAFPPTTQTPASTPSTARVARAQQAPGPAAHVQVVHAHQARVLVVRNPVVIAGRVGVGLVGIVDS